MSEQQTIAPKVNIVASEEVKKPRLGAILFCEYAARTDKDTYLLAGCFERFLFSKDDPKVTTPFYLYVRTTETKDGDFQVAIIDPNDKVILAFSYEVASKRVIPGIPASIHFLERIRIPVPVEGIYWVDVSFNGETLGGAPLIVDFSKEKVEEDERKS